MVNLSLEDQQIFEICRNATISAYEGKVDKESLNQLLSSMNEVAKDPKKAIQASASLVSAGIWSQVDCKPEHMPWIFHESAWGLGLGGGSCAGVMYHAYEDAVSGWEFFFDETVAYHAQGIANVGGIFQITWFRKDGAPIGQFNGFLAGAGVFEIGGSCKWKSN